MARSRTGYNRPKYGNGYMARSDQQKKILVCLQYAKRRLSINQIAMIIEGRDSFKKDWQDHLVLNPVRQTSIWRSLERLIDQGMVERHNPHSPNTVYHITKDGEYRVFQFERSYEQWKEYFFMFHHIMQEAEKLGIVKPKRPIMELLNEKRVVILGSRRKLQDLTVTFIPRTDPHGEKSAILRCQDAIRNAHEVWVYDAEVGDHTKRDIAYAREQEKEIWRIKKIGSSLIDL
jgi:Fe2+ or Zn2+ uptake regulation protein